MADARNELSEWRAKVRKKELIIDNHNQAHHTPNHVAFIRPMMPIDIACKLSDGRSLWPQHHYRAGGGRCG